MMEAFAAIGIVVGFFLLVTLFGLPSKLIYRENHEAMRLRAIEYDRLHGRGRSDA